MKKSFAGNAALLAATVVLASPVRAAECPFEYTLSPTLLSGDSFGDFAVGLDYALEYNREYADQFASGNLDGYFGAKFDGEFSSNPNLGRKPLVNQLRAGFSRHWMVLPAGGPGPVAGVEPAAGGARVQDYGVFAGGLAIRHETDQRLDQQNAAIGAEISYVHTKDEGIWSFIPSLVAAFDFVHSFDEPHDRHEAGDVDKDTYRIRLEASLKSSFGRQLFAKNSTLAPLGLRLDARHHELFDVDDEQDDSVTYGAVALTYTLKEQGGRWKHTTLFIRLSDGRIPPAEHDETVLAIGATNPW